ncbi:MAG: Cytochrome c1, heme protein precursor [Pseudomonadota bacterium]
MLRILVLIFTIIPAIVFANNNALEPKHMNWPFDGLFGSVDRQAAQRGFQVYKEVCSACHGLKHLYYRNLKDLGFSEAEIKELAKEHNVIDGPNDQGEMFERPGLPSDHMYEPFKNEQAARAANNGALPVDLSLITKAREDGANHIFSILTGYQDPPDDFKMQTGLSYNPYFAGKQIAMPAPLSDGQVQYADGTHATVDQMARDVVIFLQWAAEPEMEHRKSMGLKVMMFLTFFTIFFYIAKKRVWARLG